MELSLDLGHRFSYVANLLMILSELFHILPQFLQKQNQAQNAIIVRRFKVLKALFRGLMVLFIHS